MSRSHHSRGLRPMDQVPSPPEQLLLAPQIMTTLSQCDVCLRFKWTQSIATPSSGVCTDRHARSCSHRSNQLGGEHSLITRGAAEVKREQLAFSQASRATELAMRRRDRGLLKPRGKFVQRWDIATASALTYTLFITPFEVGMDLPTSLDGSLGVLFVVNQIVALIFLIDIGVNFVLPTMNKSGRYERRHSALAYNYLKGWFTIDVGTIIPFDLFAFAGWIPANAKSIRLLRVLRLFKVMKVLRASSIIQRWEHSVHISSSTQSILKYSLLALVMLHWISCAFAMLPRLQQPQMQYLGIARETLEAALLDRLDVPTLNGYPCTGCIASDPSTTAHCTSGCLSRCEREIVAELSGASHVSFIDMNENWLCRYAELGYMNGDAVQSGGAPWDVYVSSLLVAMLLLVGGVSTVLPCNTTEYAFCFICIAVGAILFAAVQGIICGVVTNGNPDETRWKQNNDALNFMMADTKLPQQERKKVREFFAKSKKLFKRRSYSDLIDNCLSNEMQGDVRYLISHDVFNGIWWLKDLDRGFLEDLSVRIRREACAPGEIISADMLTILNVGMAVRGSKFLTPGNWWGDIFITSKKLRDGTPASCLIYCEVARLTRFDFREIVEIHPHVAKPLRLASLQVALRRTITLVALSQKAGAAKAVRRGASSSRTIPENTEVSDGGNHGEAGGEALPPSIVLQTALSGITDQPWREVNYAKNSDGKKTPTGVTSEANNAVRSTAMDDQSLPEILNAPTANRELLITRMVYETNEKIESMRTKLDRLVDIVGMISSQGQNTQRRDDRVSPLISGFFPQYSRRGPSPGAVDKMLDA